MQKYSSTTKSFHSFRLTTPFVINSMTIIHWFDIVSELFEFESIWIYCHIGCATDEEVAFGSLSAIRGNRFKLNYNHFIAHNATRTYLHCWRRDYFQLKKKSAFPHSAVVTKLTTRTKLFIPSAVGRAQELMQSTLSSSLYVKIWSTSRGQGHLWQFDKSFTNYVQLCGSWAASNTRWFKLANDRNIA